MLNLLRDKSERSYRRGSETPPVRMGTLKLSRDSSERSYRRGNGMTSVTTACLEGRGV